MQLYVLQTSTFGVLVETEGEERVTENKENELPITVKGKKGKRANWQGSQTNFDVSIAPVLISVSQVL